MNRARIVILTLLLALVWLYHGAVSGFAREPGLRSFVRHVPLGVILAVVGALVMADRRSPSRCVSTRDMLLFAAIAASLFAPALLAERLFPGVEWSAYASRVAAHPDGSVELEYRLFGETRRRTFPAAEIAAATAPTRWGPSGSNRILKVCVSRSDPARVHLVAGKTRACSEAQARVNRRHGLLWLAGFGTAALAAFRILRRRQAPALGDT